MNHSRPSRDGYTVPSPRVTDAIGSALRRAHRRDDLVPGDMLDLVALIDRPTGRA